jgi:hypothetical protein
MKFLVPNYSCLHNSCLGGYCPQIPVLSVLCPQLNLLNSPPRQKSWVRHWSHPGRPESSANLSENLKSRKDIPSKLEGKKQNTECNDMNRKRIKSVYLSKFNLNFCVGLNLVEINLHQFLLYTEDHKSSPVGKV